MDRKAQQYWKDHQLWQFIQFGISYNERTGTNEFTGSVEHNGWKFFTYNDGGISYITPSGENGFFVDC